MKSSILGPSERPINPTERPMKLRINKALLSRLPPSIAEIVKDFRDVHQKAFISVDRRPSFYIQEDARYTAFGPDGRSMTVRASGEWSGITELAPGSNCPLPENCCVVETGYFLGHAFLNIYDNSSTLRTIEARMLLDKAS